jgi:glycosyltransferase involved in cell wall biosynthesis
MRIAMIFPTRESEKAISGYSSTLVDNIKEKKTDIENISYTAGSPLTLFKKFKEFKKYDVIHLQHEYNLLGWYGASFFMLYPLLAVSGVKVVTTMHTVLSQKEKFKGSKTKTFLRKLLYLTQNRWINWFSDKIVVHANFFKEILSTGYGVSREKIIVFPQGIIENIPTYNKQKIKKELKLSGPVYLFMGSAVPDHGHDIIIKRADKIKGTILVVANPGSVNDRNAERTKQYLEEIKKIVEDKNLNKFVRFDILDINDKNPLWWKYFTAADLVLLPYRGGIGSGIFAHSMAAQIPVVASNIKYFNEIARNYDCIKIAKKDNDYARAIKEAMSKQNYNKLLKGCHKYFKENSLSVVADKYKQLYLSLI